MKFNYVYMIKDKTTGEFYIGLRSCDINPKDDQYMGSMKTWSRMKYFNKDNLNKTILSIHETRKEASKIENELIKLFIEDPLNRNYYIPDSKFHTYGLKGEKSATFGRKHSSKTKELMSDIAKKRPASNRKIVLDLNNGIFYDSIKDAWKTLYYNIPFGTFFHRYKENNYYKNLVV